MRPGWVLFGACDRHNLGDLLLPHVARALLAPAPTLVAGLVGRDLRPCGGQRVTPWPALRRVHDATLLHVGGEILTCSAWSAAVMLQRQQPQLRSLIGYLEAHPAERERWLQRTLGPHGAAPYLLPRGAVPGIRRVLYCAVGGVDLASAQPAMRDEVLARLREADAVGVRDAVTHATLADAGVPALLMPDPAVMLGELWAGRFGRPGAAPQGGLAVQLSAEHGDDATLHRIARQLEAVAAPARLPVVFFRTGAAPWHDDLEVLRRAAAHVRAVPSQVFEPIDVRQVCALIAGSRACLSSSLHAGIVAAACGRPGVWLRRAGPGPDKCSAYAATWGAAAPVEAGDVGAALRAALARDPAALREAARAQARAFRVAFRLLTGRSA